MAKVLVLYYAAYGHIETMARSRGRGRAHGSGHGSDAEAREGTVHPRRCKPRRGAKADFVAPEAKPEELKDYDAVIFGTADALRHMAAQMKHFLDQTGSLWFTRRDDRQGRQRLHLGRRPAWRPGRDDASFQTCCSISA